MIVIFMISHQTLVIIHLIQQKAYFSRSFAKNCQLEQFTLLVVQLEYNDLLDYKNGSVKNYKITATEFYIQWR